RLADDLLAPAVLLDRGLVDPAYVERLRRRRAGRPYPTERLYRLWSLVLLELWLRLFVDRRGAHLEAGEAPASRVPALPRPMAA
ncbi:MAG: hypothetical protein ACJ8DY_22480, partial [Xanthobacteraceae bacterium]